MVENLGGFDRLWWLPAGGHGNGLDDAAWLAVLEVGVDTVADQVLAGMGAAGVPACAAVLARGRWTGAQPGHRASQPAPTRIWVGASRFGTARDVLLALVPRLVAEHGEDVVV